MEEHQVKGRNVYLSGAMTGLPDYGAPAFAHAHAVVKQLGANRVFNPAISWLTDISPERPHWSYMVDCINELTSRTDDITLVMSTNVDVLRPRKYDVIVMIPGWESSDGATLEREVAIACGIKVVELSELEGQ